MHRLIVWIQDVAVPVLGSPGVFLAAFLDSSFLSLPEINDLLVVTSAASSPERGWLFALMATLGSVAGCSVLWWIGWKGEEGLLERRFGVHRVARAREAFHRWDFLALAVPALMPPPMPFKIFVISAGVFGFSYARFAVTLLVARGLRYAIWAAVGIWYGEQAIEVFKNVDAWMSLRLPWILGLSAAALGAWILVRYRRRRRAERPA
jgi:membrane protein YqaA with SNARE-associated domain